MQKISPFLWFNGQAEEAANHYVNVFKNAKINHVARYGENMPMPAGTAMTVSFELDGLKFTALNGGPHFTFNESVSFVIDCKDQDEVDYYWESLLAGGGTESQCGWLKDKFGLSWQVVPRRLIELASDADKAKAGRAMQAMMGMVKINVAELERAANG